MDTDSTPTSHHNQQKSSVSKLPIKRRTPDDPNQASSDPRPPPLKYQRIWTEHDEIHFLQGLIDCSSHALSFPRDLGIFYARFSNSVSHPYTKSQLSEKLRRLRKKFRVTSTRLDNGMNESQLSLHDRAIYDLSKRLWDKDYAATSPFNGARNVGGVKCSGNKSGGSNLVGIKADFSPNLPVSSSGLGFDDDDDDDVKLELDFIDDEIKICDDEIDGGVLFSGGFENRNDQEVRLSEVNVELEIEDMVAMEDGSGAGEVKVAMVEDEIREVAVKAAMSVFEECFNEMTCRIGGGSGGGGDSIRMKWQKQRIAELDAFGNRLRLVIEHSLCKQ